MFNAGKWVAEVVSSFGSYNALQIFITHKETIEFHVNKLTIKRLVVSEDNSMDEIENINSDTMLRNNQINLIHEANQIYQKQTIVLIASYTEAIILDFLQCVFVTHPVRTYDYLNDDEKGLKGKIDLREILEADTKDSLINSLSFRAASIATRGKFKTALNNVEKISKQKLDTELSSKLSSLVERRNRIVHELADVDVTNQEVLDGFDCLSDLISNLGVMAQDNGVHVNNPHLWEQE